MSTALVLFIAGILTILLPCILPLIPIVVGASITDRHRLRPLTVAAGMVVSFVGFTFLLQVVLAQFIELADYIRIGSYYVLVLFGIAFVTHQRWVQILVALVGAVFFWNKGLPAVAVAAVLGVVALELGGRVATWLQTVGASVQAGARSRFGGNGLLTAFIIGLTLGMVWVPCAGPALGFVLSLVRDEPGLRAFVYLLIYGLGAAIPLLIVGYGGQAAVHSVRTLSQYSGRIKQVAGVLLLLSGFSLHYGWLKQLEIYLVTHTTYGSFATELEEKIYEQAASSSSDASTSASVQSESAQPSAEKRQATSSVMGESTPALAAVVSSSAPATARSSMLPDLGPAPEFEGLGTWINSNPITMQQLRGKVVLIDFWTYSCINCIRTLPYMRGYWSKYRQQPFVLIGVHSPEFAFERVESNVRDAVKRYGLAYPVVQDNQFGTWSAFDNRYWPAKYLIDARGRVRYTHFGEGAYQETDAAIASLLAEIGAAGDPLVKITDAAAQASRNQSPETYLGTRSIEQCHNCTAATRRGERVTYREPGRLALHQYALVGDWQMLSDERQVLRSPTGSILMRWQGGEIHLVLGREGAAAPATADVFIDGALVQTITIDAHTLYTLYDGAPGEHLLELKFSDPGTEAYAFTFGS